MAANKCLKSSEFSFLGFAQIDKTAKNSQDLAISTKLASASRQDRKLVAVFGENSRAKLKIHTLFQRPRHCCLNHRTVIRMIIKNRIFERGMPERMAPFMHIENIV